MISFREYLIENLNSTSMVLYHTDDKEALEHFKKFDYKNKHHVHFDDWENGIYCTYTLEDARRNSGCYGNYIYKIMIPGGVKNFFYTSYKAYKQAVNPNAKDGYWVDDVPFIDEQIKRFGLNKQELIKNNIYPAKEGKYKETNYSGVKNFQGFGLYLEEKSLLNKNIKGLEYKSDADGDCVIVFNSKDIVPLAVYDARGNLIEKFDKQTKQIGYKNSRNNLTVEKINRSDLNFKLREDKYGDCEYMNKGLKNLYGSPRTVQGRFDCSHNKLTSLKGAPEKVGGGFNCSVNQLTSLEGAPREVRWRFDCSNNRLTSLEGTPKKIGGDLDCSYNQLTSLEEIPKEISGNFDCSHNKLASLEGTPEKLNGFFNCSHNKLTSLEGCPKTTLQFDCSHNKLTSLEGCPQSIKLDFDCRGNNLTSLKEGPKKVGKNFNCMSNNLTSLEGAPKIINGDFKCGLNHQLSSLEGGPEYILQNFDCSENHLTSIKGAPKYVGENFDCSYNNLTSIEGAPEKVERNFNCYCNKLTSLKGAPKLVGRNFDCSHNQLTSLEGAPENSHYNMICNQNPKLSKEEIIKFSKKHPEVLIKSDYGMIKNGEETKEIMTDF